MNRSGLEELFDTEFRDATDNYKACCPFHSERTGSFLVHRDTGQVHCFGCGWSGNIVKAVKEYCDVSEDKATDLVHSTLDFKLSEGILRAKERKREQVPQTYPESWLQAWPQKIHNSILERGFDVEVLKQSETRYDATGGGRQVFPHRDQRGALVGAAGRSCKGQDPKWLFYWGYAKGRCVYNLPDTQWDRSSPCIVVEGVFDVLWFNQHGFHNVVGILGSRASRSQIAEIKALASTAILALDNDGAGQVGTQRLYDSLRDSMNTRFVEWPEHAKDAMDLGKEELCHLVQNSKNYLQKRLG